MSMIFVLEIKGTAILAFDADNAGGNQALIGQGSEERLHAFGPADGQEGMGRQLGQRGLHGTRRSRWCQPAGAPLERDWGATSIGRPEAQVIVDIKIPSLLSLACPSHPVGRRFRP